MLSKQLNSVDLIIIVVNCSVLLLILWTDSFFFFFFSSLTLEFREKIASTGSASLSVKTKMKMNGEKKTKALLFEI